jgi:Outer membrane protein beta-barrel domain
MSRQTKITDMKKILSILLAVVIVNTAIAQKAKVGVVAGTTWSNLYDNVDGNAKTDARMGASVGLILDAPINPCWTFQPTVQYVQKGANLPETNIEKKYIALRYAELQLNFLKTTKSGIFAGLGPVLSFAVPSKAVTENNDGKSEKALTFGNDPINDYRGMDYGANALLGVKCKNGFLISANYTLGLRNLTPAGAEPVLKSGSFGVKVGYLFK